MIRAGLHIDLSFCYHPPMKIMNVRNVDRLHYLARLEEDMDDRDYSVYPNAAEVRAADAEYIRKVGNSIKTGKGIWS